ncbi:MAG TPA: hypothetical protein VMB91_01610 [Solirubrobacteraceae bacterium]|nr:hypothetical protein [Solirubrobacteraceae bacterium]
MRRRTVRTCLTTVAGLACLAAAAASPALASSPPRGPFPPLNAVFVMNDRPQGNQVIAYSRAADGTLTQAGVYDTGGLGGQLEGSVVDHTASQGALALDRADGLLFAVNPGSDSLSVFSVSGDTLRLRQVLPSGGAFPVSVTENQGYVYVLNAGQGGSIRGFVLAGATLYPNPGARRALSLPQAAPGSGEQFTHTPAEIAFTPDGSRLVITTKAAGQSVEVFTARTLAPVPVTTPLAGTVPFGFTFDPAGRLLITEAGPNALASFSLSWNNRLTALSVVATEQAATCWVAAAGGYYYASNAGSASLTGFSEQPGGALARIGDTSTHHGTVDAASSGRFLYVQGGAEGTLDEFEVQPGGALQGIGSLVVPEAVGGEGIVAG